MTLSSTTSRVAYSGNGSTDAFAVPFLFADNAHIVATLRAAGGGETVWSETTHYSLAGAGEPSGGTLTALPGHVPASGETLVIRRVVPLTQETDYVENDPFPAEAHEQALDLAAMRDQQMQEQIDRTLRFPITDTSPLPELPSFSSRASKILGFDSVGDPTLFTPNSADADTVTAEGTTTPRALAERFGQSVSPRDFGAVGDGVADDTEAVRLAVRSGRPVDLERRLYRLTEEIDVTDLSGVIIDGGGGNNANPSMPGGFGGGPVGGFIQAAANTPILRVAGYGNRIENCVFIYASQASAADTNAVALEINYGGSSTYRNLLFYNANKSIAIPQIDFNGVGFNAVYDCRFEQIHSYRASHTHIDMRSFQGGGTNMTLHGIYINGGATHDFVSAGQPCSYAMRLRDYSGLKILGISIDAVHMDTIGVELFNCSYTFDALRFEACNLTANEAYWLDHKGGHNNGTIPFIELYNDRWTPSTASVMYVVRVNSALIDLNIGKIRILGSDFGSSGQRRALASSGPLESGTGYNNKIIVCSVEDTELKLSDLHWSETNPNTVHHWNGADHFIRARPAAASNNQRLKYGTAVPTTGTWTAGDKIINTTPHLNGILEWICTVTGFGTAAGWRATEFMQSVCVRDFDDFVGDTLDARWGSQVGSDAQVVAPAVIVFRNGLMQMTTGDDAAATMAVNGVQFTGSPNWQASAGGLMIEGRLQFSTSISDICVFFGFTDQVAALEMPFTFSGTTLTSNASDGVGFLFDSDATIDNWKLVGVANDVDATVQDAGNTPVLNTMVRLRIELATNGTAAFYINDVQVGTTMTGACTATVRLAPIFAAFSRTNASKVMALDSIETRMTRG